MQSVFRQTLHFNLQMGKTKRLSSSHLIKNICSKIIPEAYSGKRSALPLTARSELTRQPRHIMKANATINLLPAEVTSEKSPAAQISTSYAKAHGGEDMPTVTNSSRNAPNRGQPRPVGEEERGGGRCVCAPVCTQPPWPVCPGWERPRKFTRRLAAFPLGGALGRHQLSLNLKVHTVAGGQNNPQT